MLYMFAFNNWFRSLSLLSLAFLLAHSSILAQFYHAPASLSNYRGYDIYAPPSGCKQMKVYRQVPGARFPNGLDVLLERGSYDPAGRLLVWERYQSIMGDLVMRVEFAYTEDGLPKEEKSFVKGEVLQVHKIYNWQNGPDGQKSKASITLPDGKTVGECLVLSEGRIQFVEYISGPEKKLITTCDRKFRVMEMQNEASGITERYGYDPDGLLRKVEFSGENTGGGYVLSYQDERNQSGQVIRQTEQNKSAKKSMYFSYDSQGHVLGKGPNPGQNLELRHYRWDGLLNDVLFFGPEGYSREMVWLSYEF